MMNFALSTLPSTRTGSHRSGGGILFVVAIVGLVLAGNGCGRSPHEHAKSQENLAVLPVRVASVQVKPETVFEEVPGTLRAKVRATLEAKVSGRIEEMPIRLGQAVKSGDLLLRLDAAEIQARLELARASAEQAGRDWDRIASLFKGQAVTRSEYDNAEARQRMAKAAVAEAEAMMRYVEVRAPFGGVVSRKWADLGDLASPGKPLVELEDSTAIQLEADVPESILAKTPLNETLSVRLEGTNAPLQGLVIEVAPSSDPISRTVRVKVALPAGSGLIPGGFARLLIPLNEKPTVRLPIAAVVQRGQLEMVFVIANNKASMRLVRTGKRVGDEIVVLAGLEPETLVAIDGAALLVDGQPVEVK